jgi:hypothetical protein
MPQLGSVCMAAVAADMPQASRPPFSLTSPLCEVIKLLEVLRNDSVPEFLGVF